MSKIQIVIIFIIIILLTVHFKNQYKKPLINNKIFNLLELRKYNSIIGKLSCESLQYSIKLIKNLLKRLSLIF